MNGGAMVKRSVVVGSEHPRPALSNRNEDIHRRVPFQTGVGAFSSTLRGVDL